MAQAYPMPPEEALRLEELQRYDILDTAPEDAYDGLCYLASLICETRMAAITLIDEDRQWFKAKQGIDSEQTPREDAFCAYAICNPNQVMVVEDATQDDRFQDNPYVTDDPNVRFYAGAPLTTPNGRGIGTICAIHDEPRGLTGKQKRALQALGNQVMMQLELRRRSKELKAAKKELETVNEELRSSNEELDRFASVVSHELKDPLSQVVSNLDLLAFEIDEGTSEARALLEDAQTGGRRMHALIRDLLRYAKARRDDVEPQHVNVQAVLGGVRRELSGTIEETNARVTIPEDLPAVRGDPALLRRVFSNLIQNAIKYTEKASPSVRIGFQDEPDDLVRFLIEDDGIGIPDEEQDALFGVFQRASNTGDREGTGLGLALASRIVERHGGQMGVDSTLGKGSTFWFTIPRANPDEA